jgi:hypothetical protein
MGENVQNCPNDCPSMCTDGVCWTGETCSSCPYDCGPC